VTTTWYFKPGSSRLPAVHVAESGASVPCTVCCPALGSVNVMETSVMEPDDAVTVRSVSTGTVAPSVMLVVSWTGAGPVGVADVAEGTG